MLWHKCYAFTQYLLQHPIMDFITCVILMVCYCWASLCCLDDAFLHMAMQQYHVTNAWLRWACDLDLHTSAKAEPQQLDNAFSSCKAVHRQTDLAPCIVIDLFLTYPLPLCYNPLQKNLVQSYHEIIRVLTVGDCSWRLQWETPIYSHCLGKPS